MLTRRTRRLRRNNGFSLAEMMVAVAVFSLMVGVFVLTTRQAFRSIYDSMTMDAIRTQLDLTADFLMRDLKGASNVIETLGGHSASADTAIFRVPELDADGLIVADAFDYVVYGTRTDDDGNLEVFMERYDDEAASVDLGQRTFQRGLLDNAQFTFSYNGQDAASIGEWGSVARVTFTLTMSRTLRGELMEYEVTSTIALRNKRTVG